MPSKKTSDPSFEQALADLESLVDTMEKGELSLEESLKSFEKGIALTRKCQQALKSAEQKVQVLIEQDSEERLEPFAGDD